MKTFLALFVKRCGIMDYFYAMNPFNFALDPAHSGR